MRQLILILICLGMHLGIQAQSIDSFLQYYPEEYGIFTKQYHKIEFFIEQDELKAKQDVIKEILPLQDQYKSSFATQSVMHHYFSELAYLQANTLIPKGKSFTTVKMTNIKEKPVQGENIFYDDSKESEISFTNVGQGNRQEIKYGLTHRDAHLMPRFFLQNYLPIHHLKIEVVYPKGMTINFHELGGKPDWVKRSKIEGKNTITEIFEAHQVPKFKAMSGGAPATTYIPHLAIVVQDFTHPKTGKRTNYLASTKDLNAYLYPYISGVNKEISPALKQEVINLTAGMQTDAQKAKAIFNWVQEHIRYIAFEDSLGGFVPREANLVYQRRFGDCKDMSSILQVMCSAAGIPAYLTWIGTRDIPYVVSETPIPSAFNHMICAAKVDGKWVFLDATDVTTPYGAYPHPLQDKEAFINMGPDAYEIVRLPVVSSNNNIMYDTTYMKIADKNLIGNISMLYHGYPAWELKSLLNYSQQKNKADIFQSITHRGNNKYQQKDYEYKTGLNEQKDFKIQANFSLNDYMQQVGNSYYVNMHLKKHFANTKIELKDIKAPMQNDFKKKIIQVVELEVPAGYKVTYMPEPISYAVEQIGKVDVQYKSIDNKVQMISIIDLDYILVQPTRFKEFNQLADVMQKAYKESIELSLQ